MRESVNGIDAVLKSRRSIRAFLPTPVARAEIEAILEAIMIAARGRGLDTCPQAAFTPFHRVIASHLDLPDEEQLVCGMSLGWADQAARVNQLRTEREPVERFAKFFE